MFFEQFSQFGRDGDNKAKVSLGELCGAVRDDQLSTCDTCTHTRTHMRRHLHYGATTAALRCI